MDSHSWAESIVPYQPVRMWHPNQNAMSNRVESLISLVEHSRILVQKRGNSKELLWN